MTAIHLLQISASVFGFAMIFILCNFYAMASCINDGSVPKWWMYLIHIVFNIIASVSGMTMFVCAILWLVKNLQ